MIKAKVATNPDACYGDSAEIDFESDEWIALTNDFKKYSVGVVGSQMTRVITLFSVMAQAPMDNPNATVIIYLDDIYYE